MSKDLNKVVLSGRLVRDLEVRKTASDTSVVSYTLAVNRYSPKGESAADFISCVTFGGEADAMAQFLKKGDEVIIEDGRISTRSYEKNDGSKVYVTEVIAQGIIFRSRRNDHHDQDADQDTQSVGLRFDGNGQIAW